VEAPKTEGHEMGDLMALTAIRIPESDYLNECFYYEQKLEVVLETSSIKTLFIIKYAKTVKYKVCR
jgi:hypothetical protein